MKSKKRHYQHTELYTQIHAKRVEARRVEKQKRLTAPRTYYVYKLVNRDSGKSYIGCTSNIKQSIKYMFRGAPRSAIAQAIKLNGEQNFLRKIMFETHDKQEAARAELLLIDTNPRELSYNAEINPPYTRIADAKQRETCICPRCSAKHTKRLH